MANIDLSKPVQTRDGREARVLQLPDGKLVGGIKRDTEWTAYVWDSNGNMSGYPTSPSSLVNVPEP